MVPTSDVRLLLDVQETCTALKISRTQLYAVMQRGELPPVRIGRSVRFAVRDVEAFIERQREAAL
ncbi:MAG: helix-turn-helix domain-containing protein [Dehalococcoidia bacterium]